MKRGRPRHDDILTPREWEVLTLLEERLTNEQIAQRLGISVDTAKFHVSEILGKLGVANRREAVSWRTRREAPLLIGLLKVSLLREGGRVAVAASIGILCLIALGVLLMSNRSPSPLGKVAYVAGGNVWVKDLSSGAEMQITITGDFVSDLRWSPSGRWLTAERDLPFETPGGFRANTLWIMDANGKRGRALENLADWHPDKDRLALAKQVPGGVEITTQDADGRNERVILTSSEEERLGVFVSWSPDGEWIAYTAYIRDPSASLPGTRITMNRVRPDGTDDEEFFRYDPRTDGPGSITYGWTADSKAYLFSLSGPVISAAVDGSGPVGPEARIALETQPSLAPDGSVTALVTGISRRESADRQIALFDPVQGSLDYLTGALEEGAYPAWSPDAMSILYAAADSFIDESQSGAFDLSDSRIWLMDRAGSNKQQLTHDARYRDEYPQMSNDGRYVLFVRVDLEAETASPSLWLLDLKTNELERQLSRFGDVTATPAEISASRPTWSRDFAWWRPD
ncbi:MAG: LuxR C-terminal-related transcriptional regulator [Dehalococcoidia bacterium]